MQLNLENHRAHIFEQNPFDSKKPTIVFIPGAGMDHRVLSMIDLKPIHSDYNILGFDLPGHGYTSGPIFYSIEEHSEFCVNVLNILEVENPILVGHS